MKKPIIIATIAILGASTGVWAHDKALGGNPDLEGAIILEHGKGSTNVEAQKGEGDLYGSMLANPDELKPNPNAQIDRYTHEELQAADPEGSRDVGVK